MDVLCTYKTGTLTDDRATLKFASCNGLSSLQVLMCLYLIAKLQSGITNILDEAIMNKFEGRKPVVKGKIPKETTASNVVTQEFLD